MLNEKVTVTICGKPYNLRTDNAAALLRQGDEAERRITEYCRELSLSKDDACVFTILDLLGELETASAQRDSYAQKNAAMVSAAEKGAKALEENKVLAAENALLTKDSAALADLRREHTELEGKNAQLTETLSEANARAAENASAKEELAKAQSQIASLEEKNAQLTATVKSGDEKNAAQQKSIAELEKQTADLKKQTAKIAALADDNKKLTEKLEKAANTEEALRRSEERVTYLEKECGKLDAANAELDTLKKSLTAEQGKTSDLEKKLAAAEKSAAELADTKQSLAAEKGRNSDLEKKLADAERTADEALTSVSVMEKDVAALREQNEELSELRGKSELYEELSVKYSQMESENAALRAAEQVSAEDGELSAQVGELKKQLSAALAEAKELKKTNASLNRQLNEMLEDGQLTL